MSSYFFGGFSANLIVPSGDTEPFLVLLHPRMVGGALDREIERHLHAALGSRGDKAPEIIERAEIGMHRSNGRPPCAPIA
jgi:hypothetical protein